MIHRYLYQPYVRYMITHRAQLLVSVTIATWFVVSTVAAQSVRDTAILRQRWDAIIGEGYSLSESALDSAVHRYGQLIASPSDNISDAFALALSLDESYILFAEATGRPRGLFPEIVERHADQVIQVPERAFMLGAAYYQNKLFPEASAAFESVIDQLPVGAKARNLAHLNLAAALNEQGHVLDAIELLKGWLNESEEHAVNLPMGLAEQTRVNLGGLQVSSRAYKDALETLHDVDTTRITPYWQAILAANVMIAHHEMRHFAQRDSVWDQSRVFDAIAMIPNEGFQALVLHQILLSRDFSKFNSFVAYIQDQGSPLLDTGGRYAELLDDEMTDSQALQSFVWFAELAAMEDTFLLQLEEDARAQAPAFEDIKQSLERQLNRNKWLHWILIAVGASVAVAGTIVFRLRRSMQQRKSKAVETVINSPRLNRPIKREVPITDHDIRILGESIAYGRRISDAMIVLKKLKANIDAVTEEVKGAELDRDLALKLNESEQVIASQILAGFDAKESSRILDVTPEYVYNLRSRIRGKLEIPAGVKMEAWLQERHARPNGEQTTE